MCYCSSHTSKVVDAQTGDVLQVNLQMHGTKSLMLAGTKMVACLKPGTEVENLKNTFHLAMDVPGETRGKSSIHIGEIGRPRSVIALSWVTVKWYSSMSCPIDSN